MSLKLLLLLLLLYFLLLLLINVSSFAHNCKCMVDGHNAMTTIRVLLLLLCTSEMHDI